jgi:hypothetical protein
MTDVRREEMVSEEAKKPYQAPTLKRYGDIEEITQGGAGTFNPDDATSKF